MCAIFKRGISVIVLSLLLMCSALAADGLDNFTDKKTMDNTTFSDVSTDHWFYDGVRSAYNMGIMEGVGSGKFNPGQSVPWSQAVTIAARVRSTYLGENIPEATGPWYQKYVNYAMNAKILPSNYPEGDAWNTKAIDRQSIAYLFQAVVGKEDCPSISDLDIPDLGYADSDKQEAVKTLYAAGIFTGKGNGFDPTGLATRAELSTILTRLLRPAYRMPHDKRVNYNMEGQWSNFTFDSSLCYDDKAFYLIFRESGLSGIKGSNHILRKDKKTGEVSTLHSSTAGKSKLQSLLISDGYLYFTETEINDNTQLKKLNLSTGKIDSLYKNILKNGLSSTFIDTFYIYDGRIFIVTSHGIDYTLNELSKGNLRPLMTFYRSCSGIYGFNGKLYIGTEHGTTLLSYDLSTGKDELCLDGVTTFTLDNGRVYFLRNYSNPIWMASLDNLDRPVKYGSLPENAFEYYINLAHNGKDLYYDSSSISSIYKIIPGQIAKKVHTNSTSYVEYPILWGDCILEGHPGLSLDNYTGEFVIATSVGTPNEQKTNVDEWLGRSSLMSRTAFPQNGKICTYDDTYLNDDDGIAVRQAYYSVNKLIIDIDYRSTQDGKDERLRKLEINARVGDVSLTKKVELFGDECAKFGENLQLTLVIQGDELLVSDADLTDMKCDITYSYNIVEK